MLLLMWSFHGFCFTLRRSASLGIKLRGQLCSSGPCVISVNTGQNRHKGLTRSEQGEVRLDGCCYTTITTRAFLQLVVNGTMLSNSAFLWAPAGFLPPPVSGIKADLMVPPLVSRIKTRTRLSLNQCHCGFSIPPLTRQDICEGKVW